MAEKKLEYKVYVDFRERHENSQDKNMVEILTKNEIPFELTHLEVGDYICENLETHEKIVVERKILNDFVGSVWDSRLPKELLQMETNFRRGFLVLVGNWADYYSHRAMLKRAKFVENVNAFTVNHRLGIFASISCRYENIRMVQVENDNQFCVLLPKLLEKSYDGKKLGDMSVIRRKSSELNYVNILTSFPNMGADKAKEIIEKYSTFPMLYQALRDGTFECKGVGNKTIEALKITFLGLNSS